MVVDMKLDTNLWTRHESDVCFRENRIMTFNYNPHKDWSHVFSARAIGIVCAHRSAHAKPVVHSIDASSAFPIRFVEPHILCVLGR